MLLGFLFMIFDSSLIQERWDILLGKPDTTTVLNIKLSDWRDPTDDQFINQQAPYMPLV